MILAIFYDCTISRRLHFFVGEKSAKKFIKQYNKLLVV